MHLALHAAEHGSSYVREQQELALALERWPFCGYGRRRPGLPRRSTASTLSPRGCCTRRRGAELAEALGPPATDQLDWEIRNVATRPRGTFHLQALADKRGLLGRAEVVRYALLPSRERVAREYAWARRGGATLVLGYSCASHPRLGLGRQRVAVSATFTPRRLNPPSSAFSVHRRTPEARLSLCEHSHDGPPVAALLTHLGQTAALAGCELSAGSLTRHGRCTRSVHCLALRIPHMCNQECEAL